MDVHEAMAFLKSWGIIKEEFTQKTRNRAWRWNEASLASLNKSRRRGVWQRRFGAHDSRRRTTLKAPLKLNPLKSGFKKQGHARWSGCMGLVITHRGLPAVPLRERLCERAMV